MKLFVFSKATPGSALVEMDFLVAASDLAQAQQLVRNELSRVDARIDVSGLESQELIVGQPEVMRAIYNRK